MAGIIGGSSAATKGLRRSHYHTVLLKYGLYTFPTHLPIEQSSQLEIVVDKCVGMEARISASWLSIESSTLVDC